MHSPQDTFLGKGQSPGLVRFGKLSFNSHLGECAAGIGGYTACLPIGPGPGEVSMSNRLAFGALAVACMTAAAAGGYIATRQNVVPAPAAAQSAPVAPTAPAPAAAPV